MRMLFILIGALLGLAAVGQVETSRFGLHSGQVGDSFVVSVTRVGPERPGVAVSTVYYLDGEIKSGRKLRELLADTGYTAHMRNTLFIGIGYIGNNIARRRRDFIPPLFDSSHLVDRLSYGHADRFYRFLTQELIPMIDARYHTNGRRTLIGHSFGGLFVLYTLLQPLRPFQNFIALSPSLWVNHGDIFRYEQAVHFMGVSVNAYLYLSAGRRETLNHVLLTTRRMHKLLSPAAYPNLRIDYREHKGKGHHNQVVVSFDELLRNRMFQ